MIDLHVTDDRKPLCDRHALAIFGGAGVSTNIRLLLKLHLFWFLNIDFNRALLACTTVARLSLLKYQLVCHTIKLFRCIVMETMYLSDQ